MAAWFYYRDFRWGQAPDAPCGQKSREGRRDVVLSLEWTVFAYVQFGGGSRRQLTELVRGDEVKDVDNILLWMDDATSPSRFSLLSDWCACLL